MFIANAVSSNSVVFLFDASGRRIIVRPNWNSRKNPGQVRIYAARSMAEGVKLKLRGGVFLQPVPPGTEIDGVSGCYYVTAGGTLIEAIYWICENHPNHKVHWLIGFSNINTGLCLFVSSLFVAARRPTGRCRINTCCLCSGVVCWLPA